MPCCRGGKKRSERIERLLPYIRVAPPCSPRVSNIHPCSKDDTSHLSKVYGGIMNHYLSSLGYQQATLEVQTKWNPISSAKVHTDRVPAALLTIRLHNPLYPHSYKLPSFTSTRIMYSKILVAIISGIQLYSCKRVLSKLRDLHSGLSKIFMRNLVFLFVPSWLRRTRKHEGVKAFL